MKEFVKKYYIQLSIIVLLFTSIIFMFMQARQTMVMIGEKSVELKKIQLDRVIAAEFLQNVHIFKKSSAYIDEHIDIFNVFLPNTDDAKVKLFSDLERVSEETGNGKATLVVNRSDAKKDKKKDVDKAAVDRPVLNINISFVGSYNDLVTFIQKIENMQYFSKITSIAIVKTKDAVDETSVARDDLIKTDMTINFYLDN